LGAAASGLAGCPEKLEIAKLLSESGVEQAEVGIPAMGLEYIGAGYRTSLNPVNGPFWRGTGYDV